jgi:hypothetical protein
MQQIRIRAVTLLIGAAVSLAGGCGKEPQKTGPGVEPTPGAVGSPASGRAAIRPRHQNELITDAQVRSYVLSHRVPHAQATNVTILSTSFISSQQVRSLFHSANLGLPDLEPMCLVVMSGRFVFSGPPGARLTFPIALEVFDARTGNLLQAGGLPRPPEGTATIP